MDNYEKMIKPFAEAMRVQMMGHQERGFGYRGHIQYNEPMPPELFCELGLDVTRLADACGPHVSCGTRDEQLAAILEAAADVANMAMLIALNAKALKLMPVEVTS